jgi:hypothetical protein
LFGPQLGFSATLGEQAETLEPSMRRRERDRSRGTKGRGHEEEEEEEEKTESDAVNERVESSEQNLFLLYPHTTFVLPSPPGERHLLNQRPKARFYFTQRQQMSTNQLSAQQQ